MRFAKGHGTENDFVVIPDPDGVVSLTPALVAALCDRRTGVGGDGVLRVVRTGAVPEVAGLVDSANQSEWFMDYHNADGSLAEMCGNGVRVFGRYLVRAGLAEPGELRVATRAGSRRLTVPASGDITVDMGQPEVLGAGRTTIDGRTYDGLRISIGNPHLACLVPEAIADIDLSQPPELDSRVFPEGANVELVRLVAERHIEMRVYERGARETRSCGTGAVAAAVAATHATGSPGGDWQVTVPGGRVSVALDGATSLLRGPAVLVAEGEIDDAWREARA